MSDALGGTSGGTYASVSGPSLMAAAQANQAEQGAIGQASQIAAQSTQSAIGALMSNYTTSMDLVNPIAYNGNAAGAQLNYMLGLQPYNPGAAPTAPVAPTLQTAEGQITQAQLDQYIQANTNTNGIAPGAGQQQAYIYSGAGANSASGMAPGSAMTGIDASGSHNYTGATGFEQDPSIVAAATQALAQNQLTTDQTNYNTANTAYQQQNQLYNQNEALYNQYNSLGPANAGTVSNIISNLPGYQFNLNQGIGAIQNAASASGQLNSGNLLEGLNNYAQGTASQYYGNYMSNLQQIAGLGANATSNAVSTTNNTGIQAASALSSLGTNQANSALASGQASASSYLNPAANQQVIGSYLGGGTSNAAGLLGAASSLGTTAIPSTSLLGQLGL